MVNKNFERNVYSNRHGTGKINSVSKNPTQIKVSFSLVSVISHRLFGVPLCAYISENNLGALIGAGALRADMVASIITTSI